MLKTILINPDAKLRKKSVPVTLEQVKTGTFNQLISDMKETMIAKDGIGLAAPQVNESIRLIVINTKDGVLPLINPQIIKRSWRKCLGEEGCLSAPGIYGQVKRYYGIVVKAYSPEGEAVSFKATGLFARVIQHEIDHLDGILFIDKAKKLEQPNKA